MPRDIFLENRILSADPIELIQILYEHAIRLVDDAQHALAAGDIAARSNAISRVIGILGELEGSLNHEAGGALSHNLEALYRYMRTRLIYANLHQQDGPMSEVKSLLSTLAEGWNGISPTPQAPVPNLLIAQPDPSYMEHTWTA